MASTDTETWTITGWHVLAAVVLFFGTVFAVNGVFLYSALQTHTGIVSQQPYRKGLEYNQRIAADERQQQLGWTHRVGLDAAAGRVNVSLIDRHGRPVSGLEITGFIGRPSTVQHDVRLNFAETTRPGLYSAPVSGLEPGNWLAQLEVSRLKPKGPEIVYRLRKRLWLKR